MRYSIFIAVMEMGGCLCFLKRGYIQLDNKGGKGAKVHKERLKLVQNEIFCIIKV